MPLFRYILLALGLLLAAPPIHAQSFAPGAAATDTNPQPVKLLCWSGSAYAPCSLGGGGSGGDASAANQVSVQANAGSSAAKAISVQGLAGGLSLPAAGTYFATAPSLADGGRSDLTMDSQGNLRVAVGFGPVSASIITNLGSDNSASMTGLSVYARNSVYNGTNWFRQRGDQFGTYVIPKGSGNIATGQVSVGTTATLIAAARSGRGDISLALSAANSCYIGSNGVTTTTGFPLQPTIGFSSKFTTYAAIYAVCSTTTTVSWLETY